MLPGRVALARFDAALDENRAARDRVVRINDSSGLKAAARKVRLLNGGDQRRVLLFGRKPSGNVDHHTDFAGQRLAAPALVAQHLMLHHQFALVGDKDWRKRLARFHAVRGGQAGKKQADKQQRVGFHAASHAEERASSLGENLPLRQSGKK